MAREECEGDLLENYNLLGERFLQERDAKVKARKHIVALKDSLSILENENAELGEENSKLIESVENLKEIYKVTLEEKNCLEEEKICLEQDNGRLQKHLFNALEKLKNLKKHEASNQKIGLSFTSAEDQMGKQPQVIQLASEDLEVEDVGVSLGSEGKMDHLESCKLLSSKFDEERIAKEETQIKLQESLEFASSLEERIREMKENCKAILEEKNSMERDLSIAMDRLKRFENLEASTSKVSGASEDETPQGVKVKAQKGKSTQRKKAITLHKSAQSSGCFFPGYCFLCNAFGHKVASCKFNLTTNFSVKCFNEFHALVGQKECYKCSEFGHIAARCPIKGRAALFQKNPYSKQKKCKCYRCGERGHFAKECKLEVAKVKSSKLGKGKSTVTKAQWIAKGKEKVKESLIAQVIPRAQDDGVSIRQRGKKHICYKCRNSGHIARDCKVGDLNGLILQKIREHAMSKKALQKTHNEVRKKVARGGKVVKCKSMETHQRWIAKGKESVTDSLVALTTSQDDMMESSRILYGGHSSHRARDKLVSSSEEKDDRGMVKEGNLHTKLGGGRSMKN